MRVTSCASLVALLVVLPGCMLGPTYRPPDAASLKIPAAWHATLPHDGSVVALAHWWRQFDDPALTALIDAAQADSPTIDAALARIRQARASRATSVAGLLPKLDGIASFNRSNANTQAVTSNDVSQSTSVQSGELDTSRAGLQASWELDLFGKARRGLQADDARVASRVGEWHDARVSVAADVADAYFRTRACESLVTAHEDEQRSRAATDAVTRQRVTAGFLSPADATLPQASLAEGEDVLARQRAECEADRNELVALTGLSRDALDTRLAAGYAKVPEPRGGALDALPARTIEQRPDVRASERTLAAANAEIGAAIAARLPSVSLSGSIEIDRYQAGGGQSLTLRPWMFGPTLTLPLFDGGTGAARVEGARGRYDEALANYKRKVRQAVMEVENALVRVEASVGRERAALVAQENYQRYAQTVERRFRVGSSDVLEVETARRQYVTSRQSVASARLERAQAWVALYRAVGGGWQAGGAADDGHARADAAHAAPAATEGQATGEAPAASDGHTASGTRVASEAAR
ncbi:efflux transporter outer membrane subunit [Burkholderia metallica]|uniref:efflux transporter outer membrane subunit n=1 Tax=Burkholderia metallica TaxID=488729 RepID=UPI00157AE4D2|nr:efflux transporter outer membrane subunit [Burkholderia metallica]NTZ82337.1 efflux transporter outer membrane subunit [Burkholderia metallica]